MRFIFPSILILIAIATFVVFINPTYQSIKVLQADSSQYNTALTNSQKLQSERDALAAKYQTLSPDSLDRLSKLLPDNVDNIRLILNIQQIAQTYGMSISNIKFDATADDDAASGSATAAASQTDVANSQKDYGIFNLEFATTGSYDNFLKFTKDLESSLRITDIQSVAFSSDDTDKTGGYTYTVKLQTYWLKAS